MQRMLGGGIAGGAAPFEGDDVVPPAGHEEGAAIGEPFVLQRRIGHVGE